MKVSALLLLSIILSLAGQSAKASDVYILQKQDLSSLVAVDESGSTISGLLEIEGMGLCLIPNSTCVRDIQFRSVFFDTFARMNGYLLLTDEFKNNYPIPDFEIPVSSKVLRRYGTKIDVEMSYRLPGAELTVSYFSLDSLPLQIKFLQEDSGIPDRRDISQVNSLEKKLSRNVIQIFSEAETSGLGDHSSGHGTGFFISANGYILTNRHVIESVPTCLAKRSCKLKIGRQGEVEEKVLANVRVLTCSKRHDFCLLKTQPLNGGGYFELDLEQIESSLLTLGYPADKSSLSEEEPITPLTYSFGGPVGFTGLGVSSNIFIFSGASGSPILNASSHKVVGLLSNGSELIPSENGMPGIFRPLLIINREFLLEQYLEGNIQLRVEYLIRKIRDNTDLAIINELLNEYSSIKTYYGEGKLRVLSYNHPDKRVRRQLVRFLQPLRDSSW